MIKRVTNIGELNNISSPLFPLIYSDFGFLYGSDGVFIQTVNEQETLIFSLKNQCLTLCKTSDMYDVEELLSFISFWGVKGVLSDFQINRLNLIPKKLLSIKTEFIQEKTQMLTNQTSFATYRELFLLFSGSNNSFENWYINFSKKINNSLSVGVYITCGEKIVSTALSTGFFGDKAIISGVFTLPEYRGKHLAIKCIKSLINALHSINIHKAFLWCEEDKFNFYKNIGFSHCGEIYVKEEL